MLWSQDPRSPGAESLPRGWGGGSSVHRWAPTSLVCSRHLTSVLQWAWCALLLISTEVDQLALCLPCCPALGFPRYQALPVCASQDSGPDGLPPSLYRPRLSPEFVLTFTLLRQSPPPLLCDFHISETSSPSSLSLWLTEDCLPACHPSSYLSSVLERREDTWVRWICQFVPGV